MSMSKPFRSAVRLSLTAFAACALALGAGITVSAAKAQLPAVVGVGVRLPVGTSSYTHGSQNANSALVRDAAGNLYAIDGLPEIIEIPVSGPIQIVVPSGDYAFTCGGSTPTNAGGFELASDPAGNLYLGHSYSCSTITKITRNTSNGTYYTCPTASAPCSGTGAEASVATGLGALTNNYFQINDLAVDYLGNIFVSTSGGNTVGTWTGKGILMIGPTAPSGKYLVGGSGAPTHTPVGLAVDTSGDLFYADGTNLWEMTVAQLANSTPTPTQVGSSAIATPYYVYLDVAGNVYVSQSASTAVVVNTGSTFSTSSTTYTLPGTVSGETQSETKAAIDNEGNFVSFFGSSLERYGADNDFIANSSSYFMGQSVAAASQTGSASTTYKTPSLGFLFTQATTLNATTPYKIFNYGAINGGAAAAQYSVGSSTCSGTIAAGSTCTIIFEYNPKQPGPMNGSVVLYGATGSPIAVASLDGLVTGSAVTVDPGVQTTVGTGYETPSGIAIDGSGNMYVADPDANAVYEFAPGSTTAGTSIGSGLSAPSGVAVDAGGNVYIADTGNNRVVLVPNTLTGLSSAGQTTVATTGYTLSGPRGVAIDQLGFLYIADTGNSRVLTLATPLSGSVTSGIPATVGGGFTSPYAVAVDGLGDIYVADQGANAVYMVPGGFALSATNSGPGTSVQTTVGSGFSAPTGVAVDASGSVYVADAGHQRIVRLPATVTSGVLTPPTSSTTPVVMYSGLSHPFGVAVDQTADVYFTDSYAPKVVYVNRSAASTSTAATVSFGSVAVSSTTNVTATLADAGYSTSLAITGITAPTSPFSYTATSPATCGSPTITLTPGASCTLTLTYNPTSSGTSTPGSLVLTDNAVGVTGATQTVSLIGDASGTIASVAISGPTSVVYGDDATYTVMAKDSSGNAVASISGSYTVNITGTATTTASVTLTGGTGTFYLPSLGVGSYSLNVTISSVAAPAASVAVTKAPLYLIAQNASRIFDVANPTLTTAYSGFKNGDSSSVVSGTAPTEATTATRVSPYGNYPITLTGGTLTASNYTVMLIAGNLSVTGSAPQAIFFPQLPPLTHGGTYTLTGQSTSGLPLTYIVTSGSATISGTSLTVSAAGAVTIEALQPGNSTYAAATPVSVSFTAP
jgi:sugar lactone lactonase YvrE